jgi:type I site-specific restriction endonuclease
MSEEIATLTTSLEATQSSLEAEKKKNIQLISNLVSAASALKDTNEAVAKLASLLAAAQSSLESEKNSHSTLTSNLTKKLDTANVELKTRDPPFQVGVKIASWRRKNEMQSEPKTRTVERWQTMLLWRQETGLHTSLISRRIHLCTSWRF